MMDVQGRIVTTQMVTGAITRRTITGSVVRAVINGGIPYEGDYVVTPTRERQELPTAGTSLALNVVVEAIPPEYGLVSYNGSSLRVS